MNEEVLGIIAPIEGKGKGSRWGGIKRYALIFTSNRVIVAKLADFLTIFAGALGTVGSLIDDLVSKKPSDLAGMSIEDILKADKDNYAIPHSDIIKVEIKKKGFITKPSIWISTATKKHIFLILNEEMFDRCVNLVHTTLSGKL